MSRLYYEPMPALSEAATSSPTTLQYLEKVAKLVPSEVVAGYIALVGFVGAVGYEDARVWLYWAVFALCLVLTPLYLNKQAEPNRPKRNHLIMSTVAFVVWAYAISGATLLPDWHDAAVAAIVLVVFSLVSGLVPLDR